MRTCAPVWHKGCTYSEHDAGTPALTGETNMSTNDKKALHISLTAAALAMSALVGCSAPADGEAATGAEQHVESTGESGERDLLAIATSARIDLGMVTLRDEIIVSEVAIPSEDDIKPGFELELFAPTTLRPVAGVHGESGLSLAAREMAVVNFAPLASLARRPGARQDAALYLESEIAPESLYSLPTEIRPKVAYTGAPGVAVTEDVCDFSRLYAENGAPYPGLIRATSLADGEVNGAVTTMDAPGAIKIRLVAQVEHCAGPITNEAQAKAEPRLCYEKLVWLTGHGGKGTELGRLSGYRAPLSAAQGAYCGD